MAVLGKVHHLGTLTGARADAAKKLPEMTSVYLTFQNSDNEQENVEISWGEAADLRGWLAILLKQNQGE